MLVELLILFELLNEVNGILAEQLFNEICMWYLIIIDLLVYFPLGYTAHGGEALD